MMKYNVLWIDDEWQKQADFIGEAEQEEIRITAFESHEEGMNDLIKKLHFYDAVILDARVKLGKDDTAPGLHGLTASKDRLIQINNNEVYIPFFIFTGQPGYIQSEEFRQAYGDYYIKGDDNEKLFNDLKERVTNKVEYILREKYKTAFIACSKKYMVRDYSNNLMNVLKTLDKNDLSFDPKIYFGEIRTIIEAMFRGANQFGLVHDACIVEGIVNLTESSMFLSGKPLNRKMVKCNKIHFPTIISNSVKNIIYVAGAVAHTDGERDYSRLQYEEYSGFVKTPFLLYSLIFQLLDVLVWYKQYIDQNGNAEVNKLCWEKIIESDNVNAESWITGKVSRIAENGFGTFQPSDGNKYYSIHPRIIFEHQIGEGDNLEVTLKQRIIIDQIRTP